MCKEEIDKILSINYYLILCKKKNPNCPKTEMVRKLLVNKIKKFLNIDKSIPKNS